MQLPGSLLDSLTHAEGFDKKAFEKVHTSGEQVTSVRINPHKQPMLQLSAAQDGLAIGNPVHYSLLTTLIPWTEYGYYLESRPSFTFDPLFHAGCYYVQEASSMFLEQALKQAVDMTKPLIVLDLCAAPGGKSTHIQSLISKDSLLVCNEVIRSRANVLKDNIVKWGCENVVVTNNDPRDFSRLVNYFDIIVVDAPCSGSGLFRRDPVAIHEWNENNVQLCSQRQQRILADAWPALKKEGILIYSTCSYSEEEDEEIINWVKNNFSVEILSLLNTEGWGIVESAGGYRFWPDKIKGEGFFLTCFKKKEEGTDNAFNIRDKLDYATRKEMELIGKWIKKDGKAFIKHVNTVYAWPEQHVNNFNFLLRQLRVIYSGILTGELMRDKLVPDHALAMSNSVGDSITKAELDYDQSIQYLQRKDLKIEIKEKSWQLITYQQYPLGWINALPNRINNYYPKELRILKDI